MNLATLGALALVPLSTTRAQPSHLRLTLSQIHLGDASGDARPSGPRSRLRGLHGPTVPLPQRQEVPGGVVVPLQARPAVRARVPADGEALVDEYATAR